MSRAAAFCIGHGAVEFNQDLPRRDVIAIANMDRLHDAGFQRLDGFGASGRHDLAGCRGDDIHLPYRPPRQRNEKKCHDCPSYRPSNG